MWSKRTFDVYYKKVTAFYAFDGTLIGREVSFRDGDLPFGQAKRDAKGVGTVASSISSLCRGVESLLHNASLLAVNNHLPDQSTELKEGGDHQGCSVQIPTKSPADSEMMSPGDTR